MLKMLFSGPPKYTVSTLRHYFTQFHGYYVSHVLYFISTNHVSLILLQKCMKNRKNSQKFPKNAQNARTGPLKCLFNTLTLQNTQFYG